MSVDVNPYAAPAADPTPAPVVSEFRPTPAAQNLRLFNFIIDNVVLYAATVALSFVIAVVALSAGREEILDWLDGFPGIALGLGLRLAYYIALESLFGRTLGKLATGTVVVDEHGQKPTFGQVCLRSICRFIPFEPFSFLGRVARGWHDKLPNTYVVKAR
ncbi:MAG TPA: RDD family protein [Pirellulaceae bacterium]|jgi:uncharacterized RDD family membrane protein YckC|nr:RDD family protein [Pirellulaceae bacterium]